MRVQVTRIDGLDTIPNVSDEYWFKTVSDEISQLIINGVTVIENEDVTKEGYISLSANTAYSFDIYFGELDGTAQMNFY